VRKLPKQSKIPLVPKDSREVRKLRRERDRAQGQLLRIKLRKKHKKVSQQQQTLARQVVGLTIQTTQAVIDGEI